jgi:hypothetical protein
VIKNGFKFLFRKRKFGEAQDMNLLMSWKTIPSSKAWNNPDFPEFGADGRPAQREVPVALGRNSVELTSPKRVGFARRNWDANPATDLELIPRPRRNESNVLPQEPQNYSRSNSSSTPGPKLGGLSHIERVKAPSNE